MLTDVLPELAMRGAQTVRGVLDRGGALPDADLKALLRQSRLTVDFIADFRRDASAALLKGGLEAASFRSACTVLTAALDLFLSEVPDLRSQAERLPNAAERKAQLEELAALEGQAQDARPAFAEWLAALGRPFAAMDDQRLRKGMAEAAAGEGEEVGAILARLQADGV